jgi:DNA-binding XRE family transcriptional regulator
MTPPPNLHREARRKAGFRTQGDLADHIEVNKTTVARWESGALPYPKLLALYLALLNSST